MALIMASFVMFTRLDLNLCNSSFVVMGFLIRYLLMDSSVIPPLEEPWAPKLGLSVLIFFEACVSDSSFLFREALSSLSTGVPARGTGETRFSFFLHKYSRCYLFILVNIRVTVGARTATVTV